MIRRDLIRELVEAIARVERPHPTRVAVDGIDAAGKTVLADELAASLENLGRPVIRASIDGFHNPRAVRYRRGSSSPEGYYRDSFDYDALRSALLEPLGPGGDLRYRTRVFDFRADSRVPSRVRIADPRSLLVFDGVFLLRPELREHWDFRVFAEVSFEVSVARASIRDAVLFGGSQAARARYIRRYVPGQELYLRESCPKQHADAIVYNDDPQDAAIEWRV